MPGRAMGALLVLLLTIGAAPAQRVVSMNPSLTAILVAIGAEPVLVGVDDFSARAEPAVADLPRVGGLYSPSLEAVVGLRPDLVTLVPSVEQRDFRRQLEALGIPVLALDPLSFEDVLASIATLGERVGRGEAARQRVAAIEAARSRAERRTAGRPRPSAVLILQRDPLYVVGRGSFVDDMLAAAGAENVGRELAEPWPRASLEWLIAAAPQVLLDASPPEEPAAGYWLRWPSLPAVRAGRVVEIPPGVATLPGPYLDRALALLVKALHGIDLDEPARP